MDCLEEDDFSCHLNFNQQKKRRSKMNAIIRFFKDEEGVTAIEYGLIAALIAVAIIVAVTTLGGTLSNVFSFITTEITGNTSVTSP